MYKQNKKIYLDNAAATSMDLAVFRSIKKIEKKYYANPSALYASAMEAKKYLEESRAQIAKILAAQPDTIIFTNGGTQSCNLAIQGLFSHNSSNKSQGHIITTKIEHHAVLLPIQELERQGYEVTYLSVDENGIIDINELKKSFQENTVLVSIMYANNEVGSIQPIPEIGREILKWRKRNGTSFPYFHSDACQAAGEQDIRVEHLHVDLLTLNASKIHGPKSVGVLYKRRNVPLEPIVFGGGQEFGLNPGTEDIGKAYGMALALSIAQNEKVKNSKHERNLCEKLYSELKKDLDGIILNGPAINSEQRLSNNLSIQFPGIDAEVMALYLSEKGVEVGLGSACTTDSDEVSHVLSALGLCEKAAKSTLRFTLSKYTTESDIKKAKKYITETYKKLRQNTYEQ